MALPDLLLENFDITEVAKASVVISGIRVSKAKFFSEYMNAAFLKSIGMIDMMALPDMERNRQFNVALEEVGRRILKEKYTEVWGEDDDLPDSYIDRTSFVPIVDVKSDRMILFNKATRSLSQMDIKSWERLLPPDERKVCYANARDAVLVYDPYDLSTFVPMMFEGFDVLKINTYIPPRWRLRDAPQNPALPTSVSKVLEHLFPDVAVREYVLHWCHQCLVGRNETYLVLNGAKGVGKGIFCSILSAIVGRENYSEAPVSLLTSQFNAALDKKRLIVFDEFKVGKAEHTRLKRFINKFQAIEKKGYDAENAVEIYNSYVVCNNDVSDMFLEYDDRRFSVVDLATTPLTETLSREEIEELVRRLETDEDFVREIGYYIYLRGSTPKYDEFSVWRGRRFYTLVYHSLREWQKFIVDKIVNSGQDEFEVKRLAKEFNKDEGKFSKFPRNMQKVDDFLTNYRHEGKHLIGSLVRRGDSTIIEVSEVYAEVAEEDWL